MRRLPGSPDAQMYPQGNRLNCRRNAGLRRFCGHKSRLAGVGVNAAVCYSPAAVSHAQRGEIDLELDPEHLKRVFVTKSRLFACFGQKRNAWKRSNWKTMYSRSKFVTFSKPILVAFAATPGPSWSLSRIFRTANASTGPTLRHDPAGRKRRSELVRLVWIPEADSAARLQLTFLPGALASSAPQRGAEVRPRSGSSDSELRRQSMRAGRRRRGLPR